MGTVRYHGHTVSDENLRAVLQRIADVLGDVNVESGDRDYVPKGGSKNSYHLKHRAADLHIAGIVDKESFRRLQDEEDKIFSATEHYQTLHHGPFTQTEGEHIHITHYPSGKGVEYWVEGLTKETKGVYTKIAIHKHDDKSVGYETYRAKLHPDEAISPDVTGTPRYVPPIWFTPPTQIIAPKSQR